METLTIGFWMSGNSSVCSLSSANKPNTTSATIVTDAFRAAFEERAAVAGPSWLGALRRSAFDRFAATGLPTTRDEDWKYTSLAPLARTSFRPGAALERVEATLESLRPLA